MARKRAAAKGCAENGFVEKLATTLLSSNPHINPQDPAVAKAFSLAVSSLPDGPQKTALQEHGAQYAAALQEALAAAARPATQPAGRPKKRQRAAKTAEAVHHEAKQQVPTAQATAADAAAGAAQPALEHALVDDAVYLQHVQHAAMRDRNQHVTRHAVEDAIHGGEAAALLQARAPPPVALLCMYGAPHDQLIADREFASLDAALLAAERCLALGAALSRQCGPGDDPDAGLAVMVPPLFAAVRLAQQQQQQQAEGAGAANEAVRRISALAARTLAVLLVRRRGSGSAASPTAASWLAAPQPAGAAGDAAAFGIEPRAAAEAAGEPEAAAAAPPVAIALLRAELRLLQHAAEPASGPAGGAAADGLPALSREQLLEYGRPGGAAVAAAAADMRLLLGQSAVLLVQQLLLPKLPVAGGHSDAAAATLWRVLFHAALQSGDAQADHLARLCAVQRAQAVLAAAGAEPEAAQAAAQAKRAAPPPALLAWLKEQPPSAVVTGVLAAAGRGHPQAVTAYLLDSVAPHTLQALLRSWMAAQQGLQGGDCVDAASQPAGDAAAADDDLLFYVSTEGDAAAVAPSGESGSEDEGEDFEDDAGLDLAVLPGSDADDAGSASSGSGDT